MYNATSYSFFKREVKNWIVKTFEPKISILDVGAGSGTYYNLLHENFKNIDAVEIYKPNIEGNSLRGKYRNVFNVDICDFTYEYYDLIIFGDVLEHLIVEDAQKVLDYAYDRCNNFIVALPYMYPQAGNENSHEEHLQPDLTPENVQVRYPRLELLIGNNLYGYYVKK